MCQVKLCEVAMKSGGLMRCTTAWRWVWHAGGRRRGPDEADELKLPATGPMSRETHRAAIERLQKELRALLFEYLTRKCDPEALAQDEWKFATNPPVESVKKAATEHELTEAQLEAVRVKLGTTMGALILLLLVPGAGTLRLGQLLWRVALP
jgi:hypothetical protein